jgi:hypothetical protein
MALGFGVFVLTFPARILHGALAALQDLAWLGGTFTVSWLAGTAVTVGLVMAGSGPYGIGL